ncbi:MFS transporter [Mycobacterium sp. MS1601]|uniref:MFS transporter n=1 Tax=Mycobacterium sp. MS1601 TaxID=1936029 RepID=UPI0009794A9D|nr:MFS transporter [Mycobacterium sp. MS1601]AQA01777.1 MFS transporter [Mycobacterium sp. MS1601]
MVDTLARPDQPTDPALAKMSTRSRIWLLIVSCLDVSIVVSSMIALNTALGDIAVSTSATQTQLTWVVDGYTLALACLLLPAGAIGDRYGRRGALLVGLAVFAAASAAPLIWDSPTQLIVARAVAGAGAAFIMPATLSLLTAAYPKEQRNKAVGVWAGVVGSGAVVGFLGSGVLLENWAWQSIFWAFTAAGVVMFVLTCTVSSSSDPNAAPLDWLGATLIATAVAVFVFGVVEAPVRGWTDPLVWGCLAAGLALAAAFTVVELRRSHPLLDVRLFANPQFATGAVGITFLFFANFGYFFVCIQYIQLVMGYTALETAVALVPLMGPVLLLSVTNGRWLPRVGLRVALFVGLLLIAAGLLSMRLLALDSSYLDLAWPLVVMSTGIGLCTAPTTSAIMISTPDEKQGVASAVNDATREIGAALGIAVAGSLLAARYGDVLAPAVADLPEQARGPAMNSLAEAIEVSAQLGPAGPQLVELARGAFLDAMDSSLLAMAVVLVVAAVFAGIWAPGRDGRQLRMVRAVLTRRRRASTGRHRA